MGLTLVTSPASDPISLAEAKAHCRITGSDEDGLLAGYLLAARQFCETYLRRGFSTQTWDHTLDDGWPCIPVGTRNYQRVDHRIMLPKPPMQSVTSVKYIDTSGVEQTLAADQYRVLNANQERGEGFIEPAYGVTWPTVRQQSQAITVRFVCGYESALNPFPEPIRQGMLLLIGHWFETRETVNIGNIVNELPFATEALLFPYRVFY